MQRASVEKYAVSISIPQGLIKGINSALERHALAIIILLLSAISIISYINFYYNGLGLAYNDARSHLDIGRRVVEGIKPGLAQLGSVWLPLPHALMVPTIWNDYMWHSGLSGAIQSMVSFVVTGILIYLFLEKLGVGLLGRCFGVLVFVANINILYLQSTAMTELLLLATMTAGAYYLMLWFKDQSILNLIYSAFWIMMATLVRYDGWFLLFVAALLVGIYAWRKRGYKTAEGIVVFFCTLAALGIALWFLWNLLIFKDPLYFLFGPFSARAQQTQLEAAGVLATKGNLGLSLKAYLYALLYDSYTFPSILGLLGTIVLWLDKRVRPSLRIASIVLTAPFFFNVLALFMGHSVLFVQGIMGDTWFNIRYGVMLMPSIAIFTGFLIDRSKSLRPVIIGLFVFVTFFAFTNQDATTIDDARVGSSQKNVTEVSGWLKNNVPGKEGFILISAASHDAIIFSSGLPMKRFIHEGTGKYWESATTAPDRWARWIIMRTYDNDDMTFRLVNESGALWKYRLVDSFPFADIYELKDEYTDLVQKTID